jgi:hypothetical protein
LSIKCWIIDVEDRKVKRRDRSRASLFLAGINTRVAVCRIPFGGKMDLVSAAPIASMQRSAGILCRLPNQAIS